MRRAISDRKFLEMRLQNKKVELTVLKHAQATSNAVYDNASTMLSAEIEAIEEQINHSEHNKTGYPERGPIDDGLVVVSR